MALFLFLDDAETILLVEADHEGGKRRVGDAGAELTVQRGNGGLA